MAMVIAATTTQAVLVTVAAFSSGWMGWMTMYSSPDSTADIPAARASIDVVMVTSDSSVRLGTGSCRFTTRSLEKGEERGITSPGDRCGDSVPGSAARPSCAVERLG